MRRNHLLLSASLLVGLCIPAASEAQPFLPPAPQRPRDYVDPQRPQENMRRPADVDRRQPEPDPLPRPRTPAPPPIGEEIALPQPTPTHWDKWNLFFYMRHGQHQSVKGRHHEKCWTYRDGMHHGWPYGFSTYEPRAVGATYTIPEWTPRRSYYYAYQPGFTDLPYGYSPEPYYGPLP